MKKITIILLIFINIILLTNCKKTKETYLFNDTLKNGNNETVKVIILAGQSNASGNSSVQLLKEKASTDYIEAFEQGFNNIYINAFVDGGNNKTNGFVNVYLGLGSTTEYFGPEIGLAIKLKETKEKYFIIKYTYSGTTLEDDWNINNKKLYPKMLSFIDQSLEYLKFKSYQPQIHSILWMQGESDSLKYYDNYYANLSNFVKDLRNEYGNVVFIDALISDSSYWPHYQEINNAKIKFSLENSQNYYIDTLKEKLSYNQEPIIRPDLAHYDSLSELQLGILFGEQILTIG